MLSKDLQEAIGDSDRLTPIQEASLSRIWQHNKDRAFVILTANRQERTDEENAAAFKALKRTIRSAGYGFIPAMGVGQEGEGEEQMDVREPSVIVPNKTKGADDGTLLKLALKWAKGASNPPQDYIFYADPEKGAATIKVSSGAQDIEFEKFVPNAMGRFFTRLYKHRPGKKLDKPTGRPFKYEWLGVKYADPPSNHLHGMGLESEGQVEFFRCETLDEWRELFADLLS